MQKCDILKSYIDCFNKEKGINQSFKIGDRFYQNFINYYIDKTILFILIYYQLQHLDCNCCQGNADCLFHIYLHKDSSFKKDRPLKYFTNDIDSPNNQNILSDNLGANYLLQYNCTKIQLP